MLSCLPIKSAPLSLVRLISSMEKVMLKFKMNQFLSDKVELNQIRLISMYVSSHLIDIKELQAPCMAWYATLYVRQLLSLKYLMKTI